MASFVSVPTQVTVNTSGNVLTLTGSSTTWSGSPFSISGVSGTSITSQTVLSTTSATITVTAGPQIGIAILSDGTNTFNLSIAPVNSIIINSDNFKRANSALGGVGGGTTDVLTAFEIASNQLRTTTVTGAQFTGRLIWPTQFADGTFRQHFGPGTNTTNGAVMLFARAQGTTSTSQTLGFYVFPGLALFNNAQLFSIAAGATAVHTNLRTFVSGNCPPEGWMELITSGNTITGNVYQADGVTLVASATYTGLTGTYLSAGYAGLISYNFNNFYSEYDAWESIDINANPPFMPLSTTTVFAVTGQATNFTGTPFTVSAVAGCSIFSQVVTDSTHATVTIISGSTPGNLILTDTISNTTFTILVTATPQIQLSPNFYVGNGTVTVAITGINVAFAGTPFVATGTPSAVVATTTILNANNAIITLSAGSYAGILTITDSVSGASATFQVYEPIAGTLNILYIGDSITFGTNGDPVGIMGQNLRALGYVVTQTNRGVSGTTSANWANSTGGASLSASIAAGVAAGAQWAHIMLGTNDGKTAINTSPSAYLANLTVVVNACLAAGIKPVLKQPIWTIPGAAAGQWLQGVNTNYQQYYNALAPLVDNINVFYGGNRALPFFEKYPTELADGVHPTAVGNTDLGTIWTVEFIDTITSATVPDPVGGSNSALTKAQFRDNIRQNLNRLTSLEEDPVTGKAGNPAITHPWPSNDLINSCLLKALSEVNRRAGFNEIQNVNLPVPIGTSTPQTFDIRTIGLTQGLAAGQINEIRSVWWIDSAASTPRRVYPVARDEMDRDSINYMAWSPSTPRRFSMDGYSLSLYPASSLGGTLMLIVGNGIVGFVTDTDTIETLPMDYHPVIEYVATRLVALTQSTDVEMDKSAQTFGALAAAGIMDVEKWVLRKNVEEQRSIGGQPQNGSYYGGYSYRR